MVNALHWFLTRALDAHHVPHGNHRTLFEHLDGTAKLLIDWEQGIHVTQAGLFHSIYGTSQFKHCSFPIEGRHIIRRLIGAEAEELVFEFCTINRSKFPWGTYLPPERRAVLYTIEAANLIDQGDPPADIERLVATGLLPQRVSDACAAYVAEHAEARRNAS